MSAELEDFPVQVPVTVRWSDVDMYGHVNNSVFYEWFDSAINGWLHEAAGVDPTAATVVGVVGESACSYEASIRFGDEVVVGLAVGGLGSSSITYVLGAFNLTTGARAAAGHWVHVYVGRNGPVAPVPGPIARAALEATVAIPQVMLRKLPANAPHQPRSH